MTAIHLHIPDALKGTPGMLQFAELQFGVGRMTACLKSQRERLTDSSNSRYCVGHYGDVNVAGTFMAWGSSSPYDYVSVTLRQVSHFEALGRFFRA